MSAPANPYRAQAAAGEAIYRRPKLLRVTLFIVGAFFVFLALASLSLVPSLFGWARVPAINTVPVIGVVLLLGVCLYTYFAFCAFSLVGYQELRVQQGSGDYTLITPALWVPWIAKFLERVTYQDAGIPWHSVRYSGGRADMAGVVVQEKVYKRRVTYQLRLRWTIVNRPNLMVGVTQNADEAQLMIAQVSRDLGVPILGEFTI